MKVKDSRKCVLPLLIAMAFFLNQAMGAQDFDPPARVARIGYLSGDVSMLSSGSQDWTYAPPNYPMISGDRIYAGDDAHVVIQNGSSDVRLWHDSDVTLTNLADNYEQLGLAQGAIRVRVFEMAPEGVVEVDTPNGAVIIQQPGDYRINAYPEEGAAMVEVTAGAVQISGPGVNQIVDQGQAVQMYGSNPVELGLVEMPYPDDLDQWSRQRDQHILRSISARYVSTEMPGYDDLDDYGAWAATPEYGPVWYPTGTPDGWAPYTYGHWAYVAPWGWTWVDDAPWGYAPFHYGRWAMVEGRWGWVPGPQRVVPVYSPALVAFVGGGGGVAAWFPIGVGEPYVPWYRCSSNYVRNVNVTNVNVTVIHNTTIINNYNTFITNTRTVNNVTQINTNNIQYENRTRVVAVPSGSMASGGRVQQTQVRLNLQQQQQLARTPVAVGRPPVEAPQHPMLQAKGNVARPVAAPQLLTPRGRIAATPTANTVRFNPATLPRPQPSAVIRPAPRTVVPNLRPANGMNTTGRPPENMPPNRANPPSGPINARPNTPPAPPNQVHPVEPSNLESHPTPNNPPPSRPQNETRPYAPPAKPPVQPNVQPPRPPERPEARPAPGPPHPDTGRPENKNDNKAKPQKKEDEKKPE